jgi:outer membrane receptor protein involved in Fe transport
VNSASVRPLLRVGMNYKAAEATFIRGSFGEGYRFPTMAELFVSTAIGPVGIYPNKSLRPEYGWYAELGVKQGFKIGKNIMGFADVATYINQYQNMIEFNFGSFGQDKGASNFFGSGFSSQNVGNTRILGIDFSTALTGKLGKVPIQFMMGYTYIDPKSLNWNDTLYYINYKGEKILPNAGLLQTLGADFRTTKNHGIDYASTSSSDDNVLKYRNRHTFTLDGQVSPGKWDFGVSLQVRSWMENIDYAFISPLLRSPLNTSGNSPFNAIKEYRRQNDGKPTILVDSRISRRLMKNDILTISFVMKNLLNQTYDIRPAILGAPRNYALQMAFKF